MLNEINIIDVGQVARVFDTLIKAGKIDEKEANETMQRMAINNNEKSVYLW